MEVGEAVALATAFSTVDVIDPVGIHGQRCTAVRNSDSITRGRTPGHTMAGTAVVTEDTAGVMDHTAVSQEWDTVAILVTERL